MLQVQEWLRETSSRNNLAKTLALLEHEFGVEAKLYEDSIILNYNLILARDPNHPMVRECRALQLDKNDFSVISRAFNRFLNYGEADTRESFVFDSGTVTYDKIDGSLVILYWHPYRQSWEVRTRKSAYGENAIDNCVHVKTFRELILLAMGKKDLFFLDNSNLDKSKSYVFEVVSPENRVITNYKYRDLFFLTAFNNQTGEEDEYEAGYDYISRFFNCRWLESYGWKDISTVIEMAKKMAPAEEGYVVRNSRNNRVKVKNPSYIALSLLHNGGVMTYKRVLELVDAGEDAEYLAYFPDEQEKFDFVKDKVEQVLQNAMNVYAEIQNIKEQKEFAGEALKHPFSGILFRLRAGEDVREIWKGLNLNSKMKLLKLGQ